MGSTRLWIGALGIGVVAAGLALWLRPAADVGAPLVAASLPANPSRAVTAPRPARAPAPALPAIDEPPLSVQVDRLLATHDPHDAYHAYWLVADCAAFNLNHDRIIFDDEDVKHPKRDSLPGFRSMTDEEKRHDAKLCSGMTERDRQSRLDYLAIAAKAGVFGAATTFAREGPFGDPSALETRPNDPLVQAWETTAIEQLRRAADSGADLSAIQYLGFEYGKDSPLVEKNPLLAYRYSLAWNLIMEQNTGQSKFFGSVREGLASTLQDTTPEQRAAELAAARHIADLARARRDAAGKPAPGG